MYDGPVIDCDVHNEWTAQKDLLPYLAEGWREYVVGPMDAGPIPMSVSGGYENPHGFDREDAWPPSGGPPASDPAFVASQLLEPFGIERAILSYATLLYSGSLPNPYFAAEVARAANDWLVDTWLAADSRFHGSILVANQLPDVAAAEIRRAGQNPRMVQVIMASNALGHPWGHPLFHPIYEACEELGLPIAIHAGGQGGANPPPTAGGAPNLYIEYHTLAIQGMMTGFVSFVSEGVFEKFPNLKLILVEGGVAWIPGMLWRFDSNYKGLRREVPWVKRLPSAYFRDHVRVTTQPLEIAPTDDYLLEALEAIDGQNTLLFATDYPHWDSDETTYIAQQIPPAWHSKVFYENALETFRWGDTAPAPRLRPRARRTGRALDVLRTDHRLRHPP